jgi:transcriptional regulator with XRE-family HTH domain
MTEKSKQIWQKLARSKKYREQFVSAQVKRGIPFQIRAMMKKNGLSQEKLAAQAQLTQGVISRAADPNNGNLTLNTIIRVAAGFDVAFIGTFVPFRDLVNWYSNMSEAEFQNILTFDEENAEVEEGLEMQDGQQTGPASQPETAVGSLPEGQGEAEQFTSMGKKQVQSVREIGAASPDGTNGEVAFYEMAGG